MTHLSQQKIAGGEGGGNGYQRGDPYEDRERRLKVDIVCLTVAHAGNRTVDVIGEYGGYYSENTHDKYPDKELDLHVL